MNATTYTCIRIWTDGVVCLVGAEEPGVELAACVMTMVLLVLLVF